MNPKENRLLAALSASEYKRLFPEFEFVLMPQGYFLSKPGKIQTHVYFPATSLVSVYSINADAAVTGMALAGNDGLGCPEVILGMQSSVNYAMVIGAGYGYRMSVATIREELAQNSELLALCLRFTNAFMCQVSQLILCNQHHSLQQQLSRWLLMCADRYTSTELPLTLDFIADMLGAGRTTISLAIGHLQRQGAIQHSRGKLTLLNRHKLEEGVCSCYGILQEQYQRLLSTD